MKKYVLSAAVLALNIMFVSTSFGQEKEKTKSKLGEYEEIIIKKKKDADTKVTVEIKDGEVKVDGKPIEDYESDVVSVRRRKPAVVNYQTSPSPFRAGSVTINGFPSNDPNRAFLGISSREVKEGVSVQQVTPESAAEKAGLKSGDIIVKIDNKTIEDPQDITTEIRKHKPEDKVTITYKRDGKEAKTTATLTKAKNVAFETFGNLNLSGPDGNLNLNGADFPEFDKLRSHPNFNFNYRDGQNMIAFGRPRIGIRAQDTEESNGAKVLDVAEESFAAKAGIKENDVITSFDGKKITNADDLSVAAREAKDKSSIEVKYNRDGKSQNAEIKIPKKLKTTDL
ncbi:MAG TPA: PDZ domain-containing protein [Flavitalea sp.]|nr:PDZ domain-containing protein [Flavitalea sp.]